MSLRTAGYNGADEVERLQALVEQLPPDVPE